MVITNKKYRKRRIWNDRFHRFGYYKQVPSVKIFRKTIRFFWLFIFSFLVVLILLPFLNKSEKPVHLAMGVIVYCIFGLGYLLKLLLSYIFPEIKMDKEGIIVLGNKKILWNDIKNIKVRYDEIYNQHILIKKNNGTYKTIFLKDCNFYTLRIFAKSFLREYGKN